ncbi:MAG: magnesium chelatase subunit H [Chloroflexia bacterium]
MHIVFFTLEETYLQALDRAAALATERAGLPFTVAGYAVTRLARAEVRQAAAADLARADAVFASMLFFEEHTGPVAELLRQAQAARPSLPVVVVTSAPDLMGLTRLGGLRLDTGWAARLTERAGERHKRPAPAHPADPPDAAGRTDLGRRLLSVSRALPRLLRSMPGASGDMARYLQLMQYWIHGTPENLAGLMLTLAARYGPPETRRQMRGVPVAPPQTMPQAAIFHPDAPGPFTSVAAYRNWRRASGRAVGQDAAGTVGLLSLRSSILTDNTAHIAALIHSLEADGLEPIPTYAAGLDMRTAMRRFFEPSAISSQRSAVSDRQSGGDSALRTPHSVVDVLVNLSGFALVGGMAHNDAALAEAELARLGRPLLTGVPLNFQSLADWRESHTGITPVQIAMQLAVPELEGAVEPIVYGGVSESGSRDFVAEPGNMARLAVRAGRWARLARKPPGERKVAVVLFNFPPNGGAVGSAAYLAVFPSLLRILRELRDAGYAVDIPPDAETLRRLIVEGNAAEFGTPANVAAALTTADYRRLCPWHAEISAGGWGPPPGALNSDGERILILGREFGSVFVGVQPPFGYEGDPMKLLMAKGITPHHGFAGFYAWLRGLWGADAILHFGTHGALEFMPGKQAGLSADCWPARLIGETPHVYVYSANNPSEGSIARRRGNATLVSYLSPPMEQAGLYRGLLDLKASLRSLEGRDPDPAALDAIAGQAAALHLPWPDLSPAGGSEIAAAIAALYAALLDLESRLIPVGLHEIGRPPAGAELVDLLLAVAQHPMPADGLPALTEVISRQLSAVSFQPSVSSPQLSAVSEQPSDALRTPHSALRNLRAFEEVQGLARGVLGRLLEAGPEAAAGAAALLGVPEAESLHLLRRLERLAADLSADREPGAVVAALGAGYVPPSPGADVVRNPGVVPTGRNIHALDPYSVPTAVAWEAGRRTAEALLDRYRREHGGWPRAVALVLWGTDNLKTGGEGIAQALWLIGAAPTRDALGRVAGVRLAPLAELGRPRMDVVATCSGIFRDLLPNQLVLLDSAARLAAAADEAPEQNFVRRNALAAAASGLTPDEAATRVFSNAPGAYGANINLQVETGAWEDDATLAATFMARKSFAYGLGEGIAAPHLLESALRPVELAFQNIDSIETGVSDIDHYFEYLGGVSKVVEKLAGERPAGYVLDVQGVGGRLRSLGEMVEVESRTKLLNPRWSDGMLRFGYEGVREIGVRVANTLGWSATTASVPGWVYDGLADAYVLDDARRKQMSALNPNAYQALVGRLVEAEGRGFWSPGPEVSESLRRVYGEAEDLVERVEF